MKKYIINTRIIKGSNTGINRFVSNITPYLKEIVQEKYPNYKIFYRGLLGHIWDIVAFIRYRSENVWLTSHRGSPFLKNYVITIHDLQPIICKNAFPFYYYYYYKFFIKLHLIKSKHIFTVSEKVKSDILKIYNILPEKITITYPGYEHLLKYDFTNLTPINFKYAIMYGNISKVKNSIPNIETWLKVNESNNLKLLIIGNLDKSVRKEFNDLVNNNINKIIYLKFIDDLQLFWYLKNSTYLFFNSPNEGFGIPALEAVFFRIPVLYSSNSSISEFINNYGVSVEQGNSVSLSEGLNNILLINVNDSEYDKIRSSILLNCSWIRSARIIYEIFNKC